MYRGGARDKTDFHAFSCAARFAESIDRQDTANVTGFRCAAGGPRFAAFVRRRPTGPAAPGVAHKHRVKSLIP